MPPEARDGVLVARSARFCAVLRGSARVLPFLPNTSFGTLGRDLVPPIAWGAFGGSVVPLPGAGGKFRGWACAALAPAAWQ